MKLVPRKYYYNVGFGTSATPAHGYLCGQNDAYTPGGERTGKFGWYFEPGYNGSIVPSDYYSMLSKGSEPNYFYVNLPTGVYHYQITMWKEEDTSVSGFEY